MTTTKQDKTIDLARYGLLRIAVATPEMRVADIDFNTDQIRQLATQAQEQQCSLVVFPELSVTGYTCGDLFYQQLLQQQAAEALVALTQWSQSRQIVLVVGVPICCDNRLYNCAAVIAGGRICGLVPKSNIPNSGEFYEQRWFSAASTCRQSQVYIAGDQIPFGRDLLFRASSCSDVLIGIEICEDLWAVEPPSGAQALSGATLLLNLSASPELLGKQEYRRNLVATQSARCLAAYAYAGAGPLESSTDLVYSGHCLIAENGQVLTETQRFSFTSQLAAADVDLARLQMERQRNRSFAAGHQSSFRLIDFPLQATHVAHLQRPLVKNPFVPSKKDERRQRCREIFHIQTSGLVKRMLHTGAKKAVIGLSGGLDSTLALLVTVKAFEIVGYERSGIVAVTMPGFGTTSRTRNNAEQLAQLLGVQLRVIPIDAAVKQHFQDIGHDPEQHDVTYENCQARERTQILMDIANQVGGLVIGTGDLSELALGWCTYNADHMSMYAVNSGVPKTLVRYLVEWGADEEFSGEIAAVLKDVCATPISPELLPPTADGQIEQLTEAVVGPYLLHDFYLYQVVRMHYPPHKVLMLAEQAFADDYSRSQLINWLKQFYQRFFSQQFKRSCLPDGPKVGTIALSPRGDWRMPSDASAAIWLRQLEEL